MINRSLLQKEKDNREDYDKINEKDKSVMKFNN